ncbi:MAG: 50S ribosomal protein L24 [Deltaproteobacteria bacterium]|nr:50S ribosomal protein L24 [Deltaproteobacteria bacterium]
MKIKKDDIVTVITGRDKGRKGKVLEVNQVTGRVTVEGLNMIKRHMRRGRSRQTPMGGIIEKPGTVDISNVMVVCKKCNKPVRTAVKTDAEGKKGRTCKSCKEAL